MNKRLFLAAPVLAGLLFTGATAASASTLVPAFPASSIGIAKTSAASTCASLRQELAMLQNELKHAGNNKPIIIEAIDEVRAEMARLGC
jgi:hypothetical protein